MDETRDYHTKWTQKDKEKMPYDRTYMQNLKYDTNKPVWNRNRLTDIEKDIVFKEGRGMRGWGREESGVWSYRCKLLYIENDKQQGPTV